MLLTQSTRSVSALLTRWRIFASLSSLPLPSSNPSSAVAPACAETVWIVPLLEHSWFDHVRLKRVFVTDGTRHQVVLIDVRKLLACADRDNTDYVLKPVAEWHAGKVRGIREFLDPDNPRIPQMPYVTITTRRAPGLLGWVGLEREGVVSFRNGQYRARYLADAGARWFPVEVHEREAAMLRELCGAPDDARTAIRATTLGGPPQVVAPPASQP
ncbi:hypothetical protein [Paraburkholderia sp. BL21I4N1]|uniref:plasmid fertility inhibition factor family protein n=1 Tax=Paraburkholderia sp. BL21I4N1 TaxID=1938801 RepID=UPI000CFDD0E7|nr:hypothetical protein [Paraburkholderia sp. BL21I4N1]PQV52407.1 hypothetical protein B0G83_103155 [Paraburkholderia sp. BL21I4N1]